MLYLISDCDPTIMPLARLYLKQSKPFWVEDSQGNYFNTCSGVTVSFSQDSSIHVKTKWGSSSFPLVEKLAQLSKGKIIEFQTIDSKIE